MRQEQQKKERQKERRWFGQPFMKRHRCSDLADDCVRNPEQIRVPPEY